MSFEVNHYRFYCQTESNYVYKWDTRCPSSCPNNVSHNIDEESITIVDTVSSTASKITNIPQSLYDDSFSISHMTNLIDLPSTIGISEVRDICLSNSPTASITNGYGAYCLSVVGSNDKVSIASVRKVATSSFGIGELKMGIRALNLPASNQTIRYGLYDESNGVFYNLTRDGLSIGWRENGIDTTVSQTQFNIDNVDGDGPSQYTYSMNKGYVYGITISGSGHATVQYNLYTQGVSNTLQKISLHNQTGLNITKGTFPIKVEVSNNGTGTVGSNTLYVYGRQYLVNERQNASQRVNGTYVCNVNINSVNDFVPVLSIKSKDQYSHVNANLSSIDFTTTTPQMLQIRSGGTLITPVWENIPDQKAGETSMQCDTSSMAIADGIVHWVGYMPSGTTSLRDIAELKNIYLQQNTSFSVCVKNIQSSGNISCVIRWTEDW